MHLIGEGLATLDHNNLRQVSLLNDRCKAEQLSDPVKAVRTCVDILRYLELVTGGQHGYDARIFDIDQAAIDSPLEDYLTISSQLNTTFEMLHVSNSTKRPIFNFESDTVDEAFAPDGMLSYADYFLQIIDAGIPFFIMAGEFDIRDGAYGQVLWMKEVFAGKEQLGDLWEQPRRIYHFNVSTELDNAFQVGGYWRTKGNFTYVTVPKAGHMIPSTNYDAVAQMMLDIAAEGKLLCHTGNCSVKEQMCAAMNSCNGHGVCTDQGTCKCQPGFLGADCGITPRKFEGFTEVKV